MLEDDTLADIDSLRELSPASLVEQALALARSRSLRRDRIDWEEVVPEFRSRAGNCRSFHEAHEIIRDLLRRLDDGHSFLRTPADVVSHYSCRGNRHGRAILVEGSKKFHQGDNRWL